MERRRPLHADLEGGPFFSSSRPKLRRPVKKLWVVLVIALLSALVIWFCVLSQAAHSHVESSSLSRPLSKNVTNTKTATDSGTPASLEKIIELENKLRRLKAQGKVLETDPEAVEISAWLQRVCRELLEPEPHTQIVMSLRFPGSMVSNGETQNHDVTIQLAPLELMPYAVFKFLQIVKQWQGGSFHRNAGHVLQAQVTNSRDSLAFQEYHAQYPHTKYTMGFAGRPGGPAFYISTVDNTDNHGPASQGSSSEADSCFAEVSPSSREIVDLMRSQPGAREPYGFIEDEENWIVIENFELS